MIEALFVLAFVILLLMVFFIPVTIFLLPLLGLLYVIYFYFKNKNKEEKLYEDLKKKDSGNI
ncbi:hypothetical protein KKG83_07605 [Candidatus Micrarchaeota archaeon]|nr:hypothetical protein [Candidatus Micrarchaeota archaeon]MBU2477306.1 hypothetical protein [Candidatus Micrarchaeota archaeon]